MFSNLRHFSMFYTHGIITNAVKMWHEARKQEKKIRGLMVDYKKRAERRREYYEKIKADPAQFVRVFGQACKVNLDPAVAIAAESPQSMMPWQGDNSNMIDRFDVRAHLDILPPEKNYKRELSRDQEDEERKLNYERYRIIVENECSGLTEEQALHQLYLDEQFGAINKDAEDEKNKLKDKKAAIGYTYEDSTTGEDKEEDDSEESEEEEDIETLDLDIVIDVDTLTDEQIQQLNVCGTSFGMGKSDFIKYLKKDKDEQEALKLAKLLEEEKAQFAGRKSRRERRIYKEKRLAGRKLSPPSYAARDSPKYEPYRRSSSRSKSRSRSRSRSRSPKRHNRKMYITSFGEIDSDEGECVMHGPALPPGLAKESESTNKQPGTWDGKEKKQSIRKKFEGSLSPDRSPESKDREYLKRSRTKSGSRSRDYRSQRSRSRGYRSRSRDRRRSREHGYRSRSRDRGYRPRDWRSSRDQRSPDRSRYRRSGSYGRRSRSRDRRRTRSRSRGRRSRSRDRRHVGSSHRQRSKSRSRSKSSRSSSSSRSKSRSRSSSRSKSRSKSKSKSPAKQVIKRYRRESLSSKSSESEEEEEAPKPVPKSAYSSASTKPPVLFGKSSSISQSKLTPQEKLKRKMQLALNRQFKADKKAEIIRQEKLEQEKQDREEELRQRALEMRRREREKRHRELEDRYNSDDSDSSGASSSVSKPRDGKSPSSKKQEVDSPAGSLGDMDSPAHRRGENDSPASRQRDGENSSSKRGEVDTPSKRGRDSGGSAGRGRDGSGADRQRRDRSPPPKTRRDEGQDRARKFRSRSRSRSRSSSPQRRRIVDY